MKLKINNKYESIFYELLDIIFKKGNQDEENLFHIGSNVSIYRQFVLLYSWTVCEDRTHYKIFTKSPKERAHIIIIMFSGGLIL